MRLCVGYKAFDNMYVKNCYPYPREAEIFDQLLGAKIFPNFDLRIGYHQICLGQNFILLISFRKNIYKAPWSRKMDPSKTSTKEKIPSVH